jgi:anhydro-N-acetylmuramic acid kinase
MRAIGLMSGTSMDGVDVALIETDGEQILSFGPAGIYEYRDEERAILRQAVADAAGLSDRDARPEGLAEAETLITNVHAQAVEAFMGDYGLGPEDVDVVGFHGQTVVHRPDAGLTVQLGDGVLLSDMLNMDVVHDFRAADMAAGGQGAPFVPVYHRALVEASELARPAVAINLGGVANVTFIGRDGNLLAFDTGPGNAMIDDWMFRQTGVPRDENGEAAARGRTDGRRLEALLAHPYFLQRPPKSLDRNAFSSSLVEGLSLEDGAATLTAFTVASLICGLAHLPATPQIFVLCGGGTRNATLVGNLRKLLPGRVELADDIGWNAEAIEAQAFAYMAVRTLKGLPISFPGTTGVPAPMPGGVVTRRADTLEAEGVNGSQGVL